MLTAPEATIIGALIGALAALAVGRALQKRDLLTRRKQSITDTWNALVDVRSAADDLWAEATPKNLDTFIEKARSADSAVQRASISLEKEVVEDLRSALASITTYQCGKQNLINYRNSAARFLSKNDKEGIGRDVVEENGRALDAFKRQLQDLESDFRGRIREEA